MPRSNRVVGNVFIAIAAFALLLPWLVVWSGAAFPQWAGRFGVNAESAGELVTALLECSAVLVPVAAAVLFSRARSRRSIRILLAILGLVVGAIGMYADLKLLQQAIAIVEARQISR